MRSADREPFKGFPRVPVRFDTGALHGLYTRGAFGVGLPGSKLLDQLVSFLCKRIPEMRKVLLPGRKQHLFIVSLSLHKFNSR
jgi:hypothetical protein